MREGERSWRLIHAKGEKGLRETWEQSQVMEDSARQHLVQWFTLQTGERQRPWLLAPGRGLLGRLRRDLPGASPLPPLLTQLGHQLFTLQSKHFSRHHSTQPHSCPQRRAVICWIRQGSKGLSHMARKRTRPQTMPRAHSFLRLFIPPLPLAFLFPDSTEPVLSYPPHSVGKATPEQHLCCGESNEPLTQQAAQDYQH